MPLRTLLTSVPRFFGCVQRWWLVCRASRASDWPTTKPSTCCTSWCISAIAVCRTWSLSRTLFSFFL